MCLKIILTLIKCYPYQVVFTELTYNMLVNNTKHVLNIVTLVRDKFLNATIKNT